MTDQFNMWRWKWRRRMAIAQGLYDPELVLTGGHVVNVFTEEIVRTDVAIDAGYICGIGSFPNGRTRVDVSGKYIAPSFIDAHIHLESSLVWVPEFAKAVVPRGTGAVITDPHEMANVAGLPGIEAMRAAAAELPLSVHFTAPSSVPASDLESPGATFSSHEIEKMLGWPETVGLGEVMNLQAILNATPDTAAMFDASSHTRRDGHAPHVRGANLLGYIASGIHSDHESTTLEEAREKLELGLMIMLREGSSEKNLEDLLPLVTDQTAHRFMFCSDDRDCHDLLTSGHVDDILRIAVKAGLDPARAIRLATLNPAQHYRLPEIGAVAPGYLAHLVVLDDLEQFSVHQTYFRGRLVVERGTYLRDDASTDIPDELRHSFHLAPVHLSDLRLSAEAAQHAVQVEDGQIVTKLLKVDHPDGSLIEHSDPSQDLLKLVCVERHHATGRVGVGLVRGFGLQRGALASSIAHDAHNIIAVGVDDTDILRAIALVAESQGGLAVVADGEERGFLPLPIGGLMSDQPAYDVASKYAELEQIAHELGSTLQTPLGTLAFMSLSVIPEARVTDRGLIKVGEVAS